MMRNALDVAILLVCGMEIGFAQNNAAVDTLLLPQMLEEERLLENSEDERGVLADEFDWLREHSVNLCTATAEELQRIPGVTHLLAQNILAWRLQHHFKTVSDLMSIEGMMPEQFSAMQPYVVAHEQTTNSFSVQYRTRSISEIERRKGYEENIYQGSPLKEYNRFNASMTDTSGILFGMTTLEVGALAEKDAGERSPTDFTTAYISGFISSLHTKFIIGDYSVAGAEGLVFNQSLIISKSSDVLASIKNNAGSIRPYHSTDENKFCRGIAASTDWKNLQLQWMYSRRGINATVDSSGAITSFDASGLFRTENEQAHRSSASEQILGGRMNWHPGREWNFGMAAYHSAFDHPFHPTAADPNSYNQLNVKGADISYTTTHTDVFSEIAFSQHARAWIGGVTAKPMSALEVSLVARDYAPDFLNLHASAFGEHDDVKNESGIYSAARIKIVSWLRASVYYDQFKFPQVNAQTFFSGTGNDALGLLEIRMNRRCEVDLYARRKSTPQLFDANDEFGRTVQRLGARVQQNYKLTVSMNSTNASRLSTRLEFVHVEEEVGRVDEYGYLFSQSVQWKLSSSLHAYLQATMYKTDSYDSRLYRYEDELPGAFTNAMLYGEGVRWYVLLQFDVADGVQLFAKYTCLVKNGVCSLGSGNDEIQGNTLQQISVQMDVKF